MFTYDTPRLMTVADNDWPVADSEDDDILQPLYGPGTPDTSGIQTAADQPLSPQRGHLSSTLVDESLFTPPPARMDSTIGDFTSVPSTVVPRARPMPRVVMKKAQIVDDPADVSYTSFSHISDPSIPTRRTNDSIHPAMATSLGFSEAADDAYSSLDIADRAKMRSRKKTQATKRLIPPPDEVIELTSDEDEFSLKPTKRQKKQENPKPKAPRPKPRLKVKKAAVILDDPPSVLTVTQYPQELHAQLASSSQLPASTLPTVPPSTPPQAREDTLYSPPLVTTHKRKKIRPLIVDDDDDEMDIIGSNLTGVSSPLINHPPFFAPSSSSFPTDSGVEIPPVEPLSGRDKKKQSSSKNGRQAKTQNKGKRGKKARMTSAIARESAGTDQEPSVPPAACHSPGKTNSPMVRDTAVTKKATGIPPVTKKGKAKADDFVEEEYEPVPSLKSNTASIPAMDEGEGQKSKENLRPDDPSSPKEDSAEHTSTASYSRARGTPVKPKSTAMSELIRRVNSQPSSPFPNASRTYSPFLKSSRTMLSRIAPLHPNRRTPPPPPPRPPPSKKSKKRLEMEEKIDEELAETIEGWSCLTDEERKALRKARIDAELGYE